MQTQRFDFINVSKEFAMARFVQTRLAASNAPSFTAAPLRLDGSRTLAAFLMAAVLAALMVVAEQLIDSWTDGHLMLAWVLLWSVAFSALALLARPLRAVACHAAERIHTAWANYQERRNEEAMWEYAKADPRVMQEIQLASLRQTQGH